MTGALFIIDNASTANLPLDGTERVPMVQMQTRGGVSVPVQVEANRSDVLSTPVTQIGGTSYTIAVSDQGKWLDFTNAGNVTVTVADHAAVAFPVPGEVSGSYSGNGTLTVTGSGNTVLKSSGNLVAVPPDGVFGLEQITQDNWKLYGDRQ